MGCFYENVVYNMYEQHTRNYSLWLTEALPLALPIPFTCPRGYVSGGGGVSVQRKVTGCYMSLGKCLGGTYLEGCCPVTVRTVHRRQNVHSEPSL